MNRSQRILPVYTGDVSGACSALFELGGMVVIHDPSGCNSTYNTHDETRWYNHDSLIFISALMERDAILGNDEKLVNDVVDAALELHPRFIALCNSPIPFISGTDFRAICKLIERRVGIPCFYVPTNGMHDYTVGAGGAFAAIAERLVREEPRRQATLNILGVTPLDFCEADATAELRAFAEDAGFTVTSCWAMGSTLDEVTRASEAVVNLVVSSTGLPAAQVLCKRFGTPYVVGRPYGAFSTVLADELRLVAKSGVSSWPCRDLRASVASDARCVVGEPVDVGSFAAACELEGEPGVRVVCATESTYDLLARQDVHAEGEEDVEAALARAELVYADALYAPVLPDGAQLVVRPHLAFSGRMANPIAR